ncbi:MAG: hypothetical protein J2P43_15160 [Candidatus Dormibacteraeota bacterium]|nr:hypothetical protein [Candidatus Dormibacteraeota bacterium]MBO0746357.1 hypothetical protein [Candidatus Dormibacteraeota bacterium]
MLVVIGGGEVGCYHARRLRRGVERGEVRGPVVVVDRSPAARCVAEFDGDPLVRVVRAEWSAFLGSWLGQADPADSLVPAPFQPHLLWTWLASELDLVPAPAPAGWALPYEVAGSEGTRFLSAAAWRCPATCVEPAHCPVLHGPRDWDLGDLLTQGALARGYEPAVFRCLHLAQGIGAIPVREILEARERCRRAGDEVLVATTSRCHAAVGALARSVE